MSSADAVLDDLLAEAVQEHPVPGALVGVWHDGRTEVAVHGVTSVENPLPVDRGTRFQIGSVSKTFAATAVMHLVGDGRVALDDAVRRHVPDLELADDDVAAGVTVRHLLNHTAGWDGSVTSGGDAPERPLREFVQQMVGLEQQSPPGARAAYNNASVALAGHLVERVTGQSYEDAVRSLLLGPLGLDHTGFTTDDLVPERCTVGHIVARPAAAQPFSVARPWRWPRAAAPEGGLVSTVDDQLAWAAFHLDGGRTHDGRQVVAEAVLGQMRSATVDLVGSSLGEAVGLGWFLEEVGGTATVSHLGTTNGQHAELRLVPSERLAVVVAANGTPTGAALDRAVVDEVLASRLGLRRRPLRPRDYDPARDGDLRGRFESRLSVLELGVEGGQLTLTFALQPAALAEMGGEVPDLGPCTLRLLPGDRGEFVVTDGPFEGMRGSFSRDPDRRVREVDLDGRWHRRTSD